MSAKTDSPKSTNKKAEFPKNDNVFNNAPQDIINALISGDHTAFEKIYYHFGSSIKYFLKVLTRSDEIAEDITQETFITLWEKRGNIDPSKNLKTFLYTIARNSAITYFNREKLLDKYTVQSGFSEDDQYSSEELLIAKETDMLIRIAVSRMPKMRRRVFELSKYEGWSHDRIAAELNISKSKVSDHLYQATKDIREIIVLFIALFIGS